MNKPTVMFNLRSFRAVVEAEDSVVQVLRAQYSLEAGEDLANVQRLIYELRTALIVLEGKFEQ